MCFYDGRHSHSPAAAPSSRTRYAQGFPAHRSHRRMFVNSLRSTTSRSTSPSANGALASPPRCNRSVRPPLACVSPTGFLPTARTAIGIKESVVKKKKKKKKKKTMKRKGAPKPKEEI